jgi:hypothetical protein
MIPSFDDQIHWRLALPFMLLAALLQIALAPTLSLLGGHADLLLVVAAGWALVRSPQEAMLAAPPAALLEGLLGAGPIGTPILILLVPISIALWLRSGGAVPRLPSVMTVIAISSIAALVLDLVIQFLGGARGFDLAGFGGVLIGATVLNVLIAALLYWPLKIARPHKLARKARLSLS